MRKFAGFFAVCLPLQLRHSKESRSDVCIAQFSGFTHEWNCGIHWATYTCELTDDLPEIQFLHPALQVLQL